MSSYQRTQRRFLLKGMVLSKPVDVMAEGEYPNVTNLRSYVQGTITARFGQTVVNSSAIADLSIHTVKRLNDDLPTASQAFSRILGAGTNLYMDNAAHTAFTNVDTGYSGNPVTVTAYLPLQSPDSWGYVSDSNKMSKVRVDKTVYKQGIFPPTAPPLGLNGDPMPTVNALQSDTITDCTVAGYTLDTTIFNSQALGVFGDSIVATTFDVGGTGWGNVVYTPTPTSIYQPGAMVGMTGNVETVIIDSVYTPVKTTTIAAITYDSGITGLCTIQPTAHKAKALVVNTVIRLAAGLGNDEYVRVLNVTWGQDDQPSFRCKTAFNHIATESITGTNSWRAYFNGNHTAGQAYNLNFLQLLGPGGGIATGTQGVGTAFKSATLDLSNINGRPLQDTDQLTFVMLIADPLAVTEVQFILILDTTPTAAPTNFYQVSIRTSDFLNVQQATGSSLTAKQRKLQRQQVDNTAAAPDLTLDQIRQRLQKRLQKVSQAGNLSRAADIQAQLDALVGHGPVGGAPESSTSQAGVSQYMTFRFRVSDITRFGADASLNWANVTGIMVRELFSNQTGVNRTPAVNFVGVWIGGSFGPDVGDAGQPYQYRFRYRSSVTGAKSAYGPATRSGVNPKNNRVQLVPVVSSDAQVDKIDWIRFGGNLPFWTYLGTGPNTTVQFNDDFPDDAVADNAVLDIDFENFPPYPSVGLPVTGTCNASGTTVSATGGLVFNVNWAQDTEVIVNGVSTKIYRVISTSIMEVIDNLGALTSVSFFAPEPLVLGTALSSQWGPFGQGLIGAVLFACNDPNNPGTLYWTNPDNPDAASDKNQLVVTSPSERLINGLIHDGKSYVFSSDNLYEVIVTLGGTSSFATIKTPCGRGLWPQWGMCTGGGYIWFISKDGIYRTQGGPAEKVSEPLEPLFSHDGQPGTTTNGIIPPDFTVLSAHQLHWGAGTLRYDYRGTDTNRYTLTYRDDTGWGRDTYGRPGVTSYYEEGQVNQWLIGANNGKLYTHSGTSDDGVAIACTLQTGAYDEGDARTRKLFADFLADFDCQGATITVAAAVNNFATSLTTSPATIATGVSRAQTIIDISDGTTTGAGFYARNFGWTVTWSSTTAVPVLYLMEDSWNPEPEDSALRRTEYDDLGLPGMKFIQGVIIKADTGNSARTVDVYADNGTNGLETKQLTLQVQHNGISEIAHPLANETWVPFQAHGVRLQPTDSATWRKFPEARWIFEPAPELALNWQTQQFSFGGYWHIRDGQIAYQGAPANITITFVIDGTSYAYLIIPPDTGFHKFYLSPLAVKGKFISFEASSTAVFQLFVQDTYFRTGEWGRSGAYDVLRPFGGQSRAVGAAV